MATGNIARGGGAAPTKCRHNAQYRKTKNLKFQRTCGITIQYLTKYRVLKSVLDDFGVLLEQGEVLEPCYNLNEWIMFSRILRPGYPSCTLSAQKIHMFLQEIKDENI